MDLRLPEEVIPHRPPSLYITGVQEIIPGQLVRGFWVPDDSQFLGHFPEEPMLMGKKQEEALCQLGCYAAMYANPGELAVSLVGTDRSRWPEPVFPGETLELNVEIINQQKRMFQGVGRAAVNGEITCELAMTGMIMSKALQVRALNMVKTRRRSF